ncbi:MAG: acetolactate synthase small subunit [Ruminococcaceae bacterium]|nr:acetolactate synthase small subunit [Oscillospiraceae bacterium]
MPGRGCSACHAFNIESLAVGVTDDPTLSRITIIVDSGNSVVEQMEKQLNKLVEVIKVRTLDENSMIGRELMLIKVNAGVRTRENVLTICQVMGAKVTDMTPTTMTMEISDTPARVDDFEAMMRSFNILEVARTGVIALQKGPGKM